MTYDEVSKKMTEAVKNPDTVQADILGILADMKTDYEMIDAQAEAIRGYEKRVADLQNTNNSLVSRLVLTQTGTPEKDPDEEEPLTGQDYVNDFINKKLSQKKED